MVNERVSRERLRMMERVQKKGEDGGREGEECDAEGDGEGLVKRVRIVGERAS